MTDLTRIAVVGVGHLGRHHARKILASPRAKLAALVDLDEARAQTVADELETDTVVANDIRALHGELDAVVIAATTSAHHAIALAAAELGLHALIEKPIAPTPVEAQAMLHAMTAAGKVLQVGHTERFNPAIQSVLGMKPAPLYITAERLAPFSGRSVDVDVVLDLMIHDIDIVASLVPSEVTEVRAVGVPILTNETDMASARIAFADGTVAELKAGRASLEASRKIRMITRDRYVSIDCASQDVKCVRRLGSPNEQGWPQIAGEPIEVIPRDALEAQLDDFLDAIEQGVEPTVTGLQGLRAVSIAHAIQVALDQHSHDHVQVASS